MLIQSDFDIFGGTMGAVAGEKIVRSFRRAIRQARCRSRPCGLEWAAALCSSWIGLRGQDPAIRVGLAGICGEQVIVVAMDRYADGAGSGGAITLGHTDRVGGQRLAVTGALGTAQPGDQDRRLAKAARSFIAANPSPANPSPANPGTEPATRC